MVESQEKSDFELNKPPESQWVTKPKDDAKKKPAAKKKRPMLLKLKIDDRHDQLDETASKASSVVVGDELSQSASGMQSTVTSQFSNAEGHYNPDMQPRGQSKSMSSNVNGLSAEATTAQLESTFIGEKIQSFMTEMPVDTSGGMLTQQSIPQSHIGDSQGQMSSQGSTAHLWWKQDQKVMFSKDFSKVKPEASEDLQDAAAEDSASKQESQATAGVTDQGKGVKDSTHQEEEESKDGAASDSQGVTVKGNKELGGIEVKLSDFIEMQTIGQGAGGSVIKAVHRPTKKIIALKRIILYNNEKLQKHITVELQTLSDCNCDNILRSYGAFIRDGKVHIALEYMDAGSLGNVLKKVGQVSEQIIGIITVQILRGLEYLHKVKKVTHRDIKPANILLNRDGVVKIADFGVSGQMEGSTDQMSSWVGTMQYMSPERLQGDQYRSDTDIWSLGIVLAECALGKYPYKEQPQGFWEMMQVITQQPVPQITDDFSDELKDFLSICLRKQGGTRSSATALLQHPFAAKYADTDTKYLRRWVKSFDDEKAKKRK